MSSVLNSIGDQDLRKLAQHAERQGFILSSGTRGVVVRKELPPRIDGGRSRRYVVTTIVTKKKNDRRVYQNALHDLLRAGYDPDWEAPKKPTTAYTFIPPEMIYDSASRAIVDHDSQEAQSEPWETGPMMSRFVRFLEHHPLKWWSTDYVIRQIDCPNPSTIKNNATHIRRRSKQILYENGSWAWDNALLTSPLLRLEALEQEARAKGDAQIPFFLTKGFDDLGRLVLIEVDQHGEDDREWIAVPKPIIDREEGTVSSYRNCTF